MDIRGPVDLDILDGPLIVADPEGGPFAPFGGSCYTLVIGPEGGLHPDEVPSGVSLFGFSDRVMRTETAAVVGASVILSRVRWA